MIISENLGFEISISTSRTNLVKELTLKRQSESRLDAADVVLEPAKGLMLSELGWNQCRIEKAKIPEKRSLRWT